MVNNQQQFKDNQGVVLLITLMILTVMMVSVLALAQVIVGEVKSIRYADNAIVSFYSAESGMEKALYELKQARAADDYTDFTALASTNHDVSFYADQSFTYGAIELDNEIFTAEDLTTSTFAYVDLIEPGADLSLIANQYNCYELDWRIDNCFPSHASDRLEITFTSLDQGFAYSTTTKHTAVCNCVFGSNSCQTFSGSDIDQNKFYRFSFRPLDNNVASTTFQAYKDAVSCPTSPSVIPGEASITVTGNYHSSFHTITATLPVHSPISDIFSYVIFSEQEILKGY